jgi:cell division protein FtsZ
LQSKIGITLIATGFQHKDPFTKTEIKKKQKEEGKIVMMLGQHDEIKNDTAVIEEINEEIIIEDTLAPRLVENVLATDEPVSAMMIVEGEEMEEHEKIELVLQPENISTLIVWDLNANEKISMEMNAEEPGQKNKEEIKNSTTPLPAASGGYLARPSNIYAETQAGVFTPKPSAEKPVPSTPIVNEEQELFNMKLVERQDIPAADMPLAHQIQKPLINSVEDSPLADETEDQKRRAAERLQKLRNLSFNINAADPNNEFETVPAYIRRNMELYGASAAVVENFYSNYEVKTDENNQTKISTINTFLDGKKPD